MNDSTAQQDKGVIISDFCKIRDRIDPSKEETTNTFLVFSDQPADGHQEVDFHKLCSELEIGDFVIDSCSLGGPLAIFLYPVALNLRKTVSKITEKLPSPYCVAILIEGEKDPYFPSLEI